jgi:hypothetical protein
MQEAKAAVLSFRIDCLEDPVADREKVLESK